MPAQEIDTWFRSKEALELGRLKLRPRAHPKLADLPLSVSRGQAEAFFAANVDNSVWIIKKFHRGRAPDLPYLRAIRGILPASPRCRAGKERQVLAAADVRGRYRPDELLRWLDGAILMPRIDGVDWATMADAIRSGDMLPPSEGRLRLCRSFAVAIDELEAAGCSHRDLSCSNVYVDGQTWQVSIIDWDSMYHDSLTLPANTSGGTQGYVAPFACRGGGADVRASWRPRADRFALAILCAEFLGAEPGTPLEGDGGLFSQDELRRRAGRTVDAVRDTLCRAYTAAAALFDRTLQARGFDDCPAPEDWVRCCDSLLGGAASFPRLADVAWPEDEEFLRALAQRTPPPPMWPAPRLDDLPDFASVVATLRPATRTLPPMHPAPPLPEDPFAAGGGP